MILRQQQSTVLSRQPKAGRCVTLHSAFWLLAFLFALLICAAPTKIVAQRRIVSPTRVMSAIHLSFKQRRDLVLAYRAGAHYSLGLPFAAIVWQESSACANAVESSAGAYGCAQVKEVAAKAVTGFKIPTWDLADPDLQDENMAIGARYLDLCMQRVGWPAGIGCYYVGIRAAIKLGKRRLVKLRYTQDVLARMAALRHLPWSED